jgi:hypothetical protein
VLVKFSESPDNVAALVGTPENGIGYLPYTGHRAESGCRAPARYDFVKRVWFFGTESPKSYQDSSLHLHRRPVHV